MCVSPACGFRRPEQTTRDLGFLEDVAGETGAWDGPPIPTPPPLWPCPDARKLGAEPEPRRDQDPVSQEGGGAIQQPPGSRGPPCASRPHLQGPAPGPSCCRV